MNELTVSDRDFVKKYFKIWNHKTKNKSPETENQPHCVIVGGVPASGKTGVLQGYDGKNYVQIDIDSLRPFHPKFEEWKYDQMMAKWTNPCVNKWYSRLIEECGKKGYNMVIETTLKNDEWLKAAGALKNAGYKIDVKAVTCPIDQSVLSAHTRYETNIDQHEHGRYVFFSVIKDSNAGLPAVMETLAKSGVPDNCEIYSRLKFLRAVNQDTDVQKEIAAERTRPKTAEEYAEMREKWDDVKGMMNRRNATVAEYEQLRDFIDGAVSIMEKEGYTKENIDFMKDESKSFENRIKQMKVSQFETAIDNAFHNLSPDIAERFKEPIENLKKVVKNDFLAATEYSHTDVNETESKFKTGDFVEYRTSSSELIDRIFKGEAPIICGKITEIKDQEYLIDTPIGLEFKSENSLRLITEKDFNQFNERFEHLTTQYLKHKPMSQSQTQTQTQTQQVAPEIKPKKQNNELKL